LVSWVARRCPPAVVATASRLPYLGNVRFRKGMRLPALGPRREAPSLLPVFPKFGVSSGALSGPETLQDRAESPLAEAWMAAPLPSRRSYRDLLRYADSLLSLHFQCRSWLMPTFTYDFLLGTRRASNQGEIGTGWIACHYCSTLLLASVICPCAPFFNSGGLGRYGVQ